MRRTIRRESVLCGALALSCVESFSSHVSFSSASHNAGHDLSFVLHPQQFELRTIQGASRRRGRWDCQKYELALLSSNSNDADENSGLTPLFPELANPVQPPQQSSTYDEAADALQNLRRGRPSAGERGERALSASDEIRNAMASGGLEGAARAIHKAMSKGGDWYDGEAEDNISEMRGDEDVPTQGLDAENELDRNEERVSPLTNLDFLLGKLDENNE